MNKKLMAAAVIAPILGLVVTAYAQFGGLGGPYMGPNGGGGYGMQSRCLLGGTRSGGDGSGDLSTPRNINRTGFVYARVKYHPQPDWRYTMGGREIPWHHDYPDGDTMFPDNLGQLTLTTTDPESYQIVDIDSKELFKYPFVYMSEPGYLDLLPADVKNLREYFDRGGFLLLDDFRGYDSSPRQFLNVQEQMAKVFPDRTIERVPSNHAIFHSFFDINPSDMLPPYVNQDSGSVQFLSISDEKGRIQVMIDLNNDMSEYWQTLDTKQCSLHEAGKAVQLGINYAVYAMTH